MSFQLEEDIISEVQKQNNIIEIIEEYVSLRKRGKNFVGLCPFHNEKTPSFSVSPEKQVYYCFGCGRGGNVFTFLMDYHKIDFHQALELLAERANISLKQEIISPEKRKLLEEKERLLNILKLTADFYYRNLVSTITGKSASKYLQERGISEESIENFKLGFAPHDQNALIRFLSSKGFELADLEKAGLVAKNDRTSAFYDRFRGRIIFPIGDKKGRIIAFGGRVLDEGNPKYLNSPETILFSKSKTLYALDKAGEDIRRQGFVLLVEGYMDAIIAHQFGFKNTVATLGTALTAEHAKTLKIFTNEILLAYDADSAGHSATLRGIKTLVQYGIEVKIVELPSGMDPDEVIRKDAGRTFLQCIEKALPFIDYRIKIETANLKKDDPQAKAEVVKNLQEDFANLTNEVEKWEYVKKLSSIIEVKEEILYNDFFSASKSKRGMEKQNIAPQTVVVGNGIEEAEINILKYMLQNKDFAQKLVKGEEFLFLTSRGQKIAKIIVEAWDKEREGEEFLLSHPDLNADDRSFLARLLIRDITYLEETQVISDSFNILRNKYLEAELENLNAKLKIAEKEGDSNAVMNIIKKINEIVRKLKS